MGRFSCKNILVDVYLRLNAESVCIGNISHVLRTFNWGINLICSNVRGAYGKSLSWLFRLLHSKALIAINSSFNNPKYPGYFLLCFIKLVVYINLGLDFVSGYLNTLSDLILELNRCLGICAGLKIEFLGSIAKSH